MVICEEIISNSKGRFSARYRPDKTKSSLLAIVQVMTRVSEIPRYVADNP